MRLETTYGLGDIVYVAQPTSREERHSCRPCGGEGKIKALDDSVQSCSTCYGRQYTVTHTSIYKTMALTIGEVRVQRRNTEQENVYMCVETGIGSGRLWKEEKLHESRGQAEIDAAHQLVEQEAQKQRRREAEVAEAEELVENLAKHEQVSS